jgi:hypothetical protein
MREVVNAIVAYPVRWMCVDKPAVFTKKEAER